MEGGEVPEVIFLPEFPGGQGVGASGLFLL